MLKNKFTVTNKQLETCATNNNTRSPVEIISIICCCCQFNADALYISDVN